MLKLQYLKIISKTQNISINGKFELQKMIKEFLIREHAQFV